MAADPLKKLRAIIESLPETSEKLSHGAPTWWGGKKTFACFHSGGYDEGRRAVWIKATMDAQETLIADDPDRFYKPKYLGPSGWVAMRLEGRVDWAAVRFLLVEAIASSRPSVPSPRSTSSEPAPRPSNPAPCTPTPRSVGEKRCAAAGRRQALHSATRRRDPFGPSTAC